MLALDGTAKRAASAPTPSWPSPWRLPAPPRPSQSTPLYRYLGGAGAATLPVPMMNIINGGAHADNSVDLQEFMVAPFGATQFSEALRMGAEVFHTLKGVLARRAIPPPSATKAASPPAEVQRGSHRSVLEAISQAGYKPGEQIGICLDPASSEFYKNGKYVFKKSDKSERTSEQMVEFWANWVDSIPHHLHRGRHGRGRLGGLEAPDRHARRQDPARRRRPVRHQQRAPASAASTRGIANSILVKVNQIGTLTETLDAMEMAPRAGYTAVVSHRSGETEDPFIADLAVATGAGQIKTGSASRTDRIAKYNQLLRIEEELGASAKFLGRKAFRQ